MNVDLRAIAADLRKVAAEGEKTKEIKIARLLVATAGLGLLATKLGKVRDV